MLLDGLELIEPCDIRVTACVHDHRCASAHAEIAVAFDKNSHRETLGQLNEVKCRLDL